MAESLTKGGFTLTPKTGTGNAKVSISCSERTGRVATSPVTFTAKMDGFSVSKSVSVVQEGKPEFVILDKTAFAVDKKGETITVTGVSNTSKLSFSCAADEVTFSSYTANGASATNGVAIAGDPGASAQYAFSIPVTVSVNTTASSKTYTLNITAAGGQKTAVVLTQLASTFTYDLTLAASPTSIQAGGGSSTITGKYKTFRNGELINTEDVTPTCSIPSGTAFTLSSNKVSAPNRGTTAGEERSVVVTGSYGDASSATITVSQEKNEITSYGDVTANFGGFYPEGSDPMIAHVDEYTFGAVPTAKCIFFFDVHQTIAYTSGDTREGNITRTKDVVTPCDDFTVDMDSRPEDILINANENKSESKLGPLTVKITGLGEGGKSLSTTGSVYQAAGVKTYAIPDIAIASFGDISAMGGSITPQVTYSQTWGWNGDTTGGGTLTTGGTVTYSNGTTDGKVSAGSLGTTLKDRSSVATVTATVTMNGKSGSKDYTVYQRANTRTVNYDNSDTTSYSDVGADGSPAIPVIGDYPCYWQYTTWETEKIAKDLLSISYSNEGSAHNNATLNASNGYVTADSLGTTAKERTNVLDVRIIFSIDGKFTTKYLVIHQAANKVESSTTSGGETIYNPVTAGAISNKTIPASGGSATATAGDGSQSWTTNKKYRHDTYTSGSVADVLVEDSKIGTDTIKPSVASISGSAESKGTIKSGITTVKEQAVTWTGNGGKKATGTMYIYQAANAEDYIKYFDPVINSFTVDDIPASGGSISSGSVTYEQARSQYFTSGAYTSLTPLTSGGTITYTKAVSASSLGTTVKDRGSVGTLTVTVTMNDKHTSQGATVYQEANIAIYGAVSVSVTPNPVSIIAAGAIYNIKPTTSQNVGFSSGDSRPGNISLSYVAKNTVTGFSNNGETVTIQPNTTTSPRKGFIVTVTASGEGSNSDSVDVTFNQAAAAAYLNVDPATINIAANATSASFNIESNDSWTIS